jgi:aspartate aminotransferase-like enzyme
MDSQLNTPAKLFSPGPTPLSQSVLEALSSAPLHHRSTEFKIILKESLKDLKLLFDEEHISVFTSTGTGALEASVVNFMSSKDTVLTVDGGKFGERWSEILSAYKIKHETYKIKWGTTPDLQELRSLLLKQKPSALCLQACETSTGTAYPINKISKLLKEASPKTLLIIDGVTAVGAYDLSMKENNIDVLISGSQKALGLPVGLSFMGFSTRAFEKAKTSDIPKYYFDVIKELKNLEKSTTWFSSPTQLWQGLHAELRELKSKGLQFKYDECLALQKILHNWAKENQLSLFSKSPSPSLTALVLPNNLSAAVVQKKMIEKGFYLATGQDDYKDKLLRIGHMANITPKEMKDFLEVLTATLKEMGH